METKIFLENEERKKKAIGLIHRVYITQLKNSRKYTAFTKTKSEVRGGGKKPWRQKGTGRARAGSLRSPLFVGGGVIFGPKPRLVSKKINKKERRLATLTALYLKKKQFIFLNDSVFENFDTVKTKNLVNLLNENKLNVNQKILFILPKLNKCFYLSTRNLKNVEVTTALCLNIKQILKADFIVFSKQTFEFINLTYCQHYE